MSLSAVFLHAAIWATEPHAAAPLASEGEVIGGVPVVRLVDHPEFHRIVVQLHHDTELTIEVVAAPTPRGACTHHGYAVQPRWELLNQPDQTVEDQPPVVRELCDRLAAEPPRLQLHPPAGNEASSTNTGGGGSEDFSAPHGNGEHPRGHQSADGPAPPTFRPLHAVLGTLLLTLLVAGPLTWRRQAQRDPAAARTALGTVLSVTGIGLIARLLLGLDAPLWSPMFGFGRFAMVLGGFESIGTYGDGYTATLTAFTAIFGAHTSVILNSNLMLGACVPPLIWGTARVLVPERPLAAASAALFAALLPTHVWISATEVMHISLVTWEVLAILTAGLFLRESPRHWGTGIALALVSALATVMAVHTRPEAIPFLLVPALLVLLHTRRVHLPGLALAAAIVATGTGLRLAEMAFDVSDEASAVQYDLLRNAETWHALLLPDIRPPGHSSLSSVLVRPTLTSPLVPLLALVGLRKSPRSISVVLAGWWAIAVVPVLPKAFPMADAWRLQAASLMPILVLAGVGFDVVVGWLRAHVPRLPTAALPVHAVLGLLLLPQLFLERPTWGTLDEARLLIRSTPNLPASSTVLFDDTHRHAEAVANWGRFAAPGSTWHAISQNPPLDASDGPLLAWLGTGCRDPSLTAAPGLESPGCNRIRNACTLTPVAVESLAFTADIDRKFTVETGEVGFYRLTTCTAPADVPPASPASPKLRNEPLPRSSSTSP